MATLLQMKLALAAINPPATTTAPDEDSDGTVAETIAAAAAGTVHIIESAGALSVDFMDRLATAYRYQRAVDTGKIRLVEPVEPAAPTRKGVK